MTESMIRIGDIEKFSIVDFPNKIAVVVFMQGCPWRCPFCYNQSLQNPNAQTEATWENLMHLLEHRKGIIDAVVFSGGEPLLQDNLPQAMDAVKAMGFEIGMHSGGYRPEALRKVIDKIIWVGFDIKTTFEKYENITRNKVSAQLAQESLNIILKSNVAYEIRTTVDSRYITFEDLKGIAKSLKGLGIQKWVLQECILRSKSGEQKLLLPNIDEIEQLKQYLKVEIRRQ